MNAHPDKHLAEALLLAYELVRAVHIRAPAGTRDVLRLEHALEITGNLSTELFPKAKLSREDRARVDRVYRGGR